MSVGKESRSVLPGKTSPSDTATDGVPDTYRGDGQRDTLSGPKVGVSSGLVVLTEMGPGL